MELVIGFFVAVLFQVALFVWLWRFIKKQERPLDPDDAELVRRVARGRSHYAGAAEVLPRPPEEG